LSNIQIESSFGSYPIAFRSLHSVNFENHYFIVDQTVRQQITMSEEKCIFINANEANKTLGSAEEVMIKLSAKGMTKDNVLVVIGGGYLQDIGTLVASLYMRGVKWVYIPTTLAAMGDSCIGGKSSINAGGVKNLVGNFYPPKEIFIDTTFVSTLPNLELIAGFSEIIKICFAKSADTFSQCLQLINQWQSDADQQTIAEIIRLSLLSKQYFVEADEFDVGMRRLLNFGHSFGHALESASDYKIPHGVAVLIGMIAASQHPLSKTTLTTRMLIDSCLSFCKTVKTEIENEISGVNYTKFSQALAKDKKNSNTDLVLILPMTSGPEIVKIPFDQEALVGATEAMKLGIEMVLSEIR